ncbi:uncharacterized protein A1O9_05396 [Exophiala aquamarina CBS 119918]|uniref:Uncharacterized protein n=1 Tax=Exophiala aquamarina CBS 119918 TaxID=1182545 RepID=A0A072PBJ6_9EURO|nr:uncharacterized protein A1O9_05396 [Exophiala aquamarina CBS 119918]KEF57479.1 hypothetical protein A1O9_05396 [Exophiala aquamarina CBS 119918]
MSQKGCPAKQRTTPKLTVLDAATQNPEDVLEQLPDFKGLGPHCIRNVVILVTPSIAPVLARKDFLQSIITRIYASFEKHALPEFWLKKKGIEIKSLSAVVDALPFRETAAAQQLESEGLSILFSSGSVFSEPGFPTPAGDDDTSYTLTFTSAYHSVDPGIPSQEINPSPVRYLTLPVANTFFVNGSRATLFQDTWKVDLSSGGSVNGRGLVNVASLVSHERRQHLQRATIAGNFHSNDLTQCVLPLTPLTESREITKAMGNVVTEIQLPERKAPASAELESSVSKYLRDNPDATAAGPLLIYASIRPPRSANAGTYETPPQDYLRTLNFLDTFEECTRLFRVTGGGGGWGKKQGLLSLDPAVDFDSHSTTDSNFPDIGEDVDDVSQLYEPKGMMPVGSSIRFWVWDHKDKNKKNGIIKENVTDHFPDLDPEQEKQSPDRVWSGQDNMHFVFGTGSRAEEREGTEGQGAVVSNKSRITHQCLYGYFGMLSYGGAAIGSAEEIFPEVTYTSRPSWHRLWAGARSRVDVPNTTFVLDVDSGYFEKSFPAEGVVE